MSIVNDMADAEFVVCGTVENLEKYEAHGRKWPLPHVRGIFCHDCKAECIISPATKAAAEKFSKPYLCVDCVIQRSEGGTA